MAANTETQMADQDEVQVENHLYHIDEDAYEQAGKSFDFAIWTRLCWSGECRVCRNKDTKKPPVPVDVKRRTTLYNAIVRCARREEFILANMSVLEVVFRILLRNRNEPMALFDIAEQIEQEWRSVIAMKSVSPAMIQRLLENRNEYKISRFAPEE